MAHLRSLLHAPLFVIAAAALASTVNVACSTNAEEDASDEGALGYGATPSAGWTSGGVDDPKAPPLNPKWKGPKPGAKDQSLAMKAEVLASWKKVKADFYDSPAGYAAGTTAPPSNEPASCLGACPPWWGDLVCHYYCWHPSYTPVDPNVRDCFSGAARGVMRNDTTPPRKLFYPEVYDYCVYQDAVFHKNRTPAYDQNLIDTNKRAGTLAGPLKWVHENEGEAYRYVMYTWFNPFAFDRADEQDVINEFYASAPTAVPGAAGARPPFVLSKKNYTTADTADVAACNAWRPRRPTDPGDGTHCSSAARPAALQSHPETATYVQYMSRYQDVTK